MGGGYGVDLPALKTYAGNMDFYTTEADKFGKLIDQAEVPEKSWACRPARQGHLHREAR